MAQSTAQTSQTDRGPNIGWPGCKFPMGSPARITLFSSSPRVSRAPLALRSGIFSLFSSLSSLLVSASLSRVFGGAALLASTRKLTRYTNELASSSRAKRQRGQSGSRARLPRSVFCHLQRRSICPFRRHLQPRGGRGRSLMAHAPLRSLIASPTPVQIWP